ncbi:hypothetical protein [Legionella genomosp. 1]|uniref:hypothetical protein n=1 Tax=Legionella genomosp. 1 TaxID=1093625 RepID=UPI0010564804|nr:hypothetical protein [Legionella genomosp. 1]
MSNLELERLFWPDIKQQIKKVNKEFYDLVEEINPGTDYPIYKLYFPYGVLIGDELSQFIAIKNKSLLRLNSSQLPELLKSEIGYGCNSSPVAMVLDKSLEWYVDLPQKKITIPIRMQKPGDFFSYTKLLDVNGAHNYSPMGVLSVMSGARTTFMLPSIGCQNKLIKLGRELNIKIKSPQFLYNQFDLFTTILNKLNSTWRSSIIYFSEKWVNSIKLDSKWYKIQRYFYKLFAADALYQKNLPHYQTAYSLLLERTNQKPNPYLMDTFKHLMDIMAGEMPGFKPLTDNRLVPIENLQDVFLQVYKLKNTVPTVMGPDYFHLKNSSAEPIYYSLQFPTTRTFSPASKQSSTMSALRDLQDISQELIMELVKENHFCSNTIIQDIAKSIDISFFHNSNDIDGEVNGIETLLTSDPRFQFSSLTQTTLIPSKDSKFFRGCIRFSHKSHID